MAVFNTLPTDHSIASQIASMINLYNKWGRHFTAETILSSAANYFVELHGDRVVGCSANVREYSTLSKIQHVCVLPQYRKNGVAVKLVEAAIRSCGTEYVYMTVREDNAASLKMAEAMRFKYVQKNWSIDHWTYVLSRRSDAVLYQSERRL